MTSFAVIALIFLLRYFYTDYQLNTLKEKANAILLSAEATREFMADQYDHNIYSKTITNEEDYLYTVPIYGAIQVAAKKAEKLNFNFRVPKVDPRNDDNTPTREELVALDRLKLQHSQKLTENTFDTIDLSSNELHFYRPVILTDDCLKCHGDPATSKELWGNDDGLDLTGAKMEGWKAREIHGAFKIEMPLDKVQANVQQATFVLIGLGIVMIIGVIIVLFLVSKRITGPLEEAIPELQKLSDGDLNLKKLKITDDEVGEMIGSMNKLSGNIGYLINENKRIVKKASNGNLSIQAKEGELKGAWKEMIEGTNNLVQEFKAPLDETNKVLSVYASGNFNAKMEKEYKGELNDLKENVNKLGHDLSHTINNIKNLILQGDELSTSVADNAETIATSAQEQSSQSDEVATAIEELAKTSIENSRSASDSATRASEAGKVTDESIGIVNQTIKKMKDIASVFEETTSNITKLGNSSKEIGEIISVINEIADQTNLLALNAAIEAARAGEQGRGFAVVAEEVRKLAERTADATEQIEEMINGIQEDTTMVVEKMENGNKEVNQGIEIVDKASSSLAGVSANSKEIISVMNTIASVTEDQSATIEEISRNVVAISEVASDTARQITSVAKSAEDLSDINADIDNHINEFITEDEPSFALKGENRKVFSERLLNKYNSHKIC
jgi:methyl-accepting chemotaxis protein